MQRKHIRYVIPVFLIVPLCVSALADPVEMPSRKAGLWEVTINRSGGHIPPQTVQHSTDATTDKEMCSKQDMQKTATGMTIDSTCNIGGMTSVSHMEVTGDFNSAYTIKMTSQNSGGPAGMPHDVATTMEGKWLGPCKADQKPGDMIMPGGVKMNIKDLQKMRDAMPKRQ
ncbi:MAG: DUF3617 family protein [Rhizobiales bacterium]|nr:DUF3617 family protein [Hyphomicrobiales bacterium]